MRLRRSHVAVAGITRRRRGRGFSYTDPAGRRVEDPEVLSRIRSLVVPPAWYDVWICPYPNGHIQAMGTDAAGRRQYRYHDRWRKARDHEKHDRALRLAERLPMLRQEVSRQLVGPGLDADRVLAAAMRMLDLGAFRTGGEAYATFGLATLHCEHVGVRRDAVTFNYPAKGGIQRSFTVNDPPLARVIAALRRRRSAGDCLLAYRDRDGWHSVRAEAINERLRAVTGEEFSGKDFRTWNATVLAATTLAAYRGPRSARALASAEKDAMVAAAEHLGNTVAVARTSYVDPRVVELFERGITVDTSVPHDWMDRDEQRVREAAERAVAAMLREHYPDAG